MKKIAKKSKFFKNVAFEQNFTNVVKQKKQNFWKSCYKNKFCYKTIYMKNYAKNNFFQKNFENIKF